MFNVIYSVFKELESNGCDEFLVDITHGTNVLVSITLSVGSLFNSINLAKEIVENIATDYSSLQEVYIFGSRARGGYLDTSDIDLMLVFKGIKEMNTIDRMNIVLKHIKGNVDYIVVDEEEVKVEDAKLLWKKGKGFVDFTRLIE